MSKKDFTYDFEETNTDSAELFFDKPNLNTGGIKVKKTKKDTSGLFPAKELRSVRKHICIQPATDKALEKMAKKNKVSYNELVNALLKDGLDRWGD